MIGTDNGLMLLDRSGQGKGKNCFVYVSQCYKTRVYYSVLERICNICRMEYKLHQSVHEYNLCKLLMHQTIKALFSLHDSLIP